MTARTRTSNDNITISGTRTPTSTGVAQVRTALVGPNKKTDDHLGNFPNANSFKSESEDFDTLVLDGRTVGSGSAWVEFDRCPLQYLRTVPSPVPPISAGAPSFLQLNNWRGEILARTNVNKPGANLPQFVGEFRDLPDMIRGVQRTWSDIFRLAATGNISWKWFVAPFVSDLWKLCQFSEGVQRRLEDFKKLRVEKEVKKRVKLGKSFATKTTNVIVNSQDMVIRADRTTVTRQNVWGSTSWKIAPGITLPQMNIDLHWRAFESYYGLTTYNGFRTLWELTPWSWFVDWFVDVSSFLDANDPGSVPCNSFNTCIMRETSTRDTYSNFTGLSPLATLSGYMYGERVTKERFVAPTGILLPTFLSPLVDQNKWLTLGSLFVIRNRSALGHDAAIRRFFRTYRGIGLPKGTPRGRKLSRAQAEAREVSRLLGMGDSLGDITTRKAINQFISAAKSGRIKKVPTYLKTYYSPRYGWVHES